MKWQLDQNGTMSDIKKAETFLFEEFPPVSKQEWEKIIERDLKGADYKEKLRWDTGEGINPLPFYRREDLPRQNPIPKKYINENPNSWEIREPIFADSIESANEAACNALSRGADALRFHLRVRRSEGMLGGDLQGVPIQNQQDFSNLLQDISPENIPLHFDAGLATPALLAMLWNEVKNQNYASDKIRATFTYDPFVYILQHGQYPKEEEALRDDIHDLADFAKSNLPEVSPLGIDARLYHSAGGTIVQELGYGITAASEYLSVLTDNGFEIEEVTNVLHFNFAIGSNYFLEIAKLRAARLLWQNLIEAYGGDAEKNKIQIHGETSQWNKTLYDPYTNMLRTSTEGMSAAIAGCDSITILPFDRHFRQPDEFSQRIARNQQLILSEENYLDRVADPSAGSYYIEHLTEEIGRAAWKLFQEVEGEGGLLKAIKNGTVQSAIEDSQQQRDQAIASRGRIFVGTNQYTNGHDKMAEKIESPYRTVSLNESDEEFETASENLPQSLATAFANEAEMGDIIIQLFDFGRHQYRTVNSYRGPQAFEKLRLATEKSKNTPKVLTLPLGNKNWRKGRSTFAANFFGCAGYDIENPIGFADVDAAINAVKDQQPEVAVICSSDKEYKKLVPEICSEFQNLENRPILVVAGYPEKDIEKYKEAGIDEFIFKNCNVLETLKRFQQKLIE